MIFKEKIWNNSLSYASEQNKAEIEKKKNELERFEKNSLDLIHLEREKNEQLILQANIQQNEIISQSADLQRKLLGLKSEFNN